MAASDGKAGRLVDILIDDENWKVQYFVVEAGSWFFRRSFILETQTLAAIDFDLGLLSLQLTKAQLEKSDRLFDVPPVSLQRRARRDRAAGWVPIWPVAKTNAAEAGPNVGVPRPPTGDPHLRSLEEILGYQLSTNDGALGKIDDFLIEDGRLTVRYLVVRLGSWLSSQRTLIAASWVDAVSWRRQHLKTNVEAEELEVGPLFEKADELDDDVERALFEHYGRDFTED